MLTKDFVNTLHALGFGTDQPIDGAAVIDAINEHLSSLENTVRIEASDDAKRQALQDIGKSAAESIAEMVAALECDYDRLEELRDEILPDMSAADKERDKEAPIPSVSDEYHDLHCELLDLVKAAGDCESPDDAEQRIQEDPLSIELTGKWTLGEDPVADRALILLGTGGPATRIVCELNNDMEPHRAWIEAQDWGTPWTEYYGDAISSDDLLTYCRCFFFGEG